jgi:CheY-like chemotaxis protein
MRKRMVGVLCARNLNSRVLVVEEHPALRDRLAGSLTAAGFVATATGDGLWALQELRDHSPSDFAVVDLGCRESP